MPYFLLRLIRFITIGKNTGISALGIVESRPCLLEVKAVYIDRSGAEQASCEAVSNRPPLEFDQAVDWHGLHQTP